MGIFDKAKDLIGQHDDKIDQGIDEAADLVDQKTGGAHGSRLDQGAETLEGRLDDLGGADQPDAGPTEPVPAEQPPANEPSAGPPIS